MTINYTPTDPVAGQSRSSGTTEVQRWTDYADTIGDVDTRLDTLESGTYAEHVFVNVYAMPASHTGFDTVAADNANIYAGRVVSSGTQNDERTHDVLLGPGTWTLELMHTQGASFGQYTITIDGASLTSLGGSADTIEGYAAATARNVRTRITGIVIAAGGSKAVKLKMATKNASSSGYSGGIQHLAFIRTA